MKRLSKKSFSKICVTLFLIVYSFTPPIVSINQLISSSENGSLIAMAKEVDPPTPTSSNITDPITQIGMCIEDAVGQSLNCTANDVSISRITNVKILDDGCKHIDDDVTFEATWEVLSTATQRYDIGLYFATQGQLTARTGQCSVSTLPNSPVPPWFNFDLDNCGDISSSSTVNPHITLTVQCLDPDGDNFLNVPYCTSWDQQAGSVCMGPSDAVPGNKAKCNCPSEGITVPITVPYSAHIEVIKEIIPSDNSDTFNLYIDDYKTPSCVGDGGSTGKITVGAGTSEIPGDTHIVGEDVDGCGTDLNDYTSSISCVDRGTQTFNGGSPLFLNSTGPLPIDVDKDDDIVCTITNALTTGTVIVHKDVVGPHGEDIYDTSTFSFSLDGTSPQTIGDDGEIILSGVVAGAHTIIESSPPTGYSLYSITPDSDGNLSNGGQFTLAVGETKHIYIVNTKNIPSIYGHKYNDVDGNGIYNSSIDTPLQDWTIFIDTNENGVLDIGENNTVTNAQGEYSFLGVIPGLNEVCEVMQTGWVQSSPIGCHQVTVGVYDAIEDIDFLNYTAPTLTLIKTVTNDDGGNKSVSDFPLFINSTPAVSGTTYNLLAGVPYTASETNTPGYTPSDWGGDCNPDGTITLAPGDNKTCTIINDDQPGTLIVRKVVINDNGGTLDPEDFLFTINDGDKITFETDGQNDFIIDAGTYSILEEDAPGYTTQYDNCEGLVIGNGETAICTITNDDIQPRLTVTKIVIGSEEPISSFDLFVDSISVISGTSNGLNAGLYTVSEIPNDDYTAIIDGDCMADGSVILDIGDEKSCTITNTRDTGNLQVIKTIDYGNITDWWFSLDGRDPVQMDSSGLIDFGQVTTNEDHIIIESGPFGTFYLNSITGMNCTPNIGNMSATATVTNGGTTICTFSNLVNKGSITIIKDSIPNDPQDFSFLATGNGVSGFILDDDDDQTLDNTEIFSGLLPGSYTFTEVTPTTGWDFEKLECTSNQTGDILSFNNHVSLDLDPGENITCTFTNIKRSTIIAHKFEDMNANGIQDIGEPNKSGWRMTLYQNNDDYCTQGTEVGPDVYTDENGNAHFDNLIPGTYSVFEWPQTDWTNTSGNPCQTRTLSPGESQTINYGNFHNTSISGTKWEDMDGDGMRELGEDGVVGWKISLWSFDYKETQQYYWIRDEITDINGNYTFTSLQPGSYVVVEESKSGWEHINPITASYDNLILQSGTPITNIDFGNFQHATAQVCKTDTEGDPINGWKVYIEGVEKVTGDDDIDGCALFTLTQAGSYTVTEESRDNWTATNPTSYTFEVQSGEAYGPFTFVNFEYAEINVIKSVLNPEGDEVLDSHVFTVNLNGSNPQNIAEGIDFPERIDAQYIVEHAGSYTISEELDPQYENIGCYIEGDVLASDFTVESGGVYTVLCVNEQKPATLTLEKILPNDNGGTKTQSDFNVYINDTLSSWGTHTLNPGAYTVFENELEGYMASVWGEDCTEDGDITLEPGDNKTCTITNNDVAPTLTVVKKVINDNGGNATVEDFEIKIGTGILTFGVGIINGYTTTYTTDQLINTAGVSYNLTEKDLLGYEEGNWECEDNDKPNVVVNNPVVLNPGQNVTCTITNDDIAPELTIIKDPTNDDGGNANPDDFSLTVGGDSVLSGVKNSYDANTAYIINETQLEGYTFTSITGDPKCPTALGGEITLDEGDDITCTIINDDVAPTLRLVKIVDYGQGQPENWTLTATGSNGFSDTGDSTTFHPIKANSTYTLSESTSGPLTEGYSQFGSWSCDGGFLDEADIRLTPGQNVTCTITNHRDTGSVKVNKRIDTDGNGSFERWNNYANNNGFNWTLDGTVLRFGTRVDNLNTTTSNYYHSLDETMPNRYHFVSWYINGTGKSCTNPNGRTLPDRIRVNKDQLTEITLCNARDTGRITIIKDSINDSWEDFYFDTNFPSGDFRLADDGYNHVGLPKERTFTVPTGTYYVDERNESGWKLTNLQCKGDGNFKINLEAGRVNIKIGYGENVTCKYTNTKLARVWGFKYNDKNANGRWNFKEYGLGNWRIFIDENHNNTYDITEPTTLTRNRPLMLGYYQFNNLLPGTYSICEQLQAGWTNTTPLCRTVRLTPGDIDGFINFGNIQYGSILVHKFEDMNGNGVIDANEGGLENWQIGVYEGDNCQGQVITNGFMDTDNHGDAQFDNIIPGHYSVMETPQDGWITTSPVCQNINVNPAQTKSVDIGNFEKGDMSVWKYEDTDGILGRTDGEEFYIGYPTFTFRVYKDNTGTWELIRESDTDGSGEAVFTNVFETVGNYYVCEVKKDGWEDMRSLYNPSNNLSGQTDEYPVCEGITVSTSDYNVNAEFGNAQLTDIHGYKWSDFNGNGVRDCIEEGEEIEEVVGFEVARGVTNKCELEPLLPGWTINLFKWNGGSYESDPFKTMLTDNSIEHYGWYWFEDLMPGKYKICEVQQDGWTQTHPLNDNGNCHEITLPISSLLDQTQSLNSILGPQYDFGNTINPELEISKSNDSNVLGMYGGESVVYTITVATPEIIEDMGLYTLKNVEVRDIMPSGFVYQTGSWTAISSTRGNLTIPEPTYGSNLPATWILGDMTEGEEITLTYTTKISLLQDPGLYKDIAWTKGSSILNEQVLGNTDSGIFVGTEVKVIEPGVIEEGEVLGTSTVITLPRTGANTYLTLGAIISMILGLILFIFNPMKKIKTLIIAGMLLFGIVTIFQPTPTYALTDSLMIKIEEPESPTKDDTFNIGFVVLDLEERALEIRCFEETYGVFGPTYTTNSGNCVVDSSIVDKSGTYQFYIQTTAGVDTKESTKVTVIVDLEKPLEVTEYEKTEGTCTYTLTFQTADDGRTSKIQIFRSNQTSFTANSATLIDELTVTPNEKITYTDNTIPNCEETYYYAIRAVDYLRNLSTITTDDIVTVNYITTPSTTEDEDTLGEDTDIQEEENGDVEEEEDTENGDIKGEEDDVTTPIDNISTTVRSFWTEYRYLIIIIGVVLISSVGYKYVKRRV